MVDLFLATVFGFVLGAAAGGFSAFLGWIKSNEAFEAKKFVLGIVTGVIAGVIAVMASTAIIQDAAADQTALLTAYITIFIGIVGIDNARTAISGAIATRAVEEQPTQ